MPIFLQDLEIMGLYLYISTECLDIIIKSQYILLHDWMIEWQMNEWMCDGSICQSKYWGFKIHVNLKVLVYSIKECDHAEDSAMHIIFSKLKI